MILKITNQCHMGCTHCMEDARPDGQHMTREVFEASLQFIQVLQPVAVLVSGGEPTDHPDTLGYLQELFKVYPKKQTIILSNGLFLAEKPELARKILSLNVDIQVVNDQRYYPRKVKGIRHKHLRYFDHMAGGMVPLGRAKESGYAPTRVGPMCFNLRSVMRSQPVGLWDAVKLLELGRIPGITPKMCFPCVTPDGGITVGETVFCHRIGTIYDDFNALSANVRTMKCNRCGLIDGMSTMHRGAIGEL